MNNYINSYNISKMNQEDIYNITFIIECSSNYYRVYKTFNIGSNNKNILKDEREDLKSVGYVKTTYNRNMKPSQLFDNVFGMYEIYKIGDIYYKYNQI